MPRGVRGPCHILFATSPFSTAKQSQHSVRLLNVVGDLAVVAHEMLDCGFGDLVYFDVALPRLHATPTVPSGRRWSQVISNTSYAWERGKRNGWILFELAPSAVVFASRQTPLHRGPQLLRLLHLMHSYCPPYDPRRLGIAPAARVHATASASYKASAFAAAVADHCWRSQLGPLVHLPAEAQQPQRRRARNNNIRDRTPDGEEDLQGA